MAGHGGDGTWQRFCTRRPAQMYRAVQARAENWPKVGLRGTCLACDSRRAALSPPCRPAPQSYLDTLVPAAWCTPHSLGRYPKMCTQYSTLHHTARGQAQPRERMPRSLQRSLALSDRTQSVRLTDLTVQTLCSPLHTCTLPPGQHPIGFHPPNPSTYLCSTRLRRSDSGRQTAGSCIFHSNGQQLSNRNPRVKKSSLWKGEALLQNGSCFTRAVHVGHNVRGPLIKPYRSFVLSSCSANSMPAGAARTAA